MHALEGTDAELTVKDAERRLESVGGNHHRQQRMPPNATIIASSAFL